MGGWQSIAGTIGAMDVRVVAGIENLREAAMALALETYGESVIEHPALVNVAALAISLQDRLVVHSISEGATRMVHETDLHTLPGEPPALLKGPWILEAKKPKDGLLFGTTANLAGYPLEDSVFLLGYGYPDGIFVARWTPHWGERDLEAGIQEEETSPLIDDVDKHRTWAREAARFALVLGIHLDAEGTPVLTREGRGERRPASGKRKKGKGWIVRRVYLDRIVKSAYRGKQPSGAKIDAEERRLEVVPVRGHLRRQPYGPQSSLRRWIYVEGYEARRWVAPRPLKIVVDAGG